nr:PREDICTED: nascent polypeptide-associated complex subunit alpha, muscle-specific form-like [Lepisosteus oculatus]
MAPFRGTIPAGPARLRALLLLAGLLAASSSAPPPQQSGPSPAPLHPGPSSPDPGRDQRGPPSSPAMGRTQALSLGLASTASPGGAHTATPEHPGTGSGRTRATESEGRQNALPAASLSARSVDGPAAPAGRGLGLNQPATSSTPPSTQYSSQGVPQKQTRKSPSTTVLVRQEVAGGNRETPVKTDQEPHSTPTHNPLLTAVSPQGFQTSGPQWTPAVSSLPLIREPPHLTHTSAPAAPTLPAPQNPTDSHTAPRQPLVSAVPGKETHPSNVTPMASSTPQPGRGDTTIRSEETELTSSQGTPMQHSPCTNHHTASPRGHAPSSDITMVTALGVGLPAGGGLITPGKATEEPITTVGVITEGADWLTGAESSSLSTAGREEDRWGVDGSTAVAPTMHSDGLAYFQPQAQTRSVKNPPGVTTATKEPSTSADHLLGTGSSGTLAQSQPTAPFSTTQVLQPQTPTQPSANPGLSSRSGDKMVTPAPRTPVSTTPPARKTKPPRATVAGVTELRVTPGLEDTGSSVSVTSSSSLPAVGGAEPTTASQQPKTAPGAGGASTPAPKAGRGFEPDKILLEGAIPPSPSLAPEPPCPAGSPGPCLPGSNRTALRWADLRRTLSFSWELHVFGSAALSLLLALGAAAGLPAAPAGGAVRPDAGLPAAPGPGGADTSSRRVPPSLSCPVSFTLSRASAQARPCTPEDDTVPFLSPGAEGDPDSEARRSFLEISRQADSVSVSSDTIDL